MKMFVQPVSQSVRTDRMLLTACPALGTASTEEANVAVLPGSSRALVVKAFSSRMGRLWYCPQLGHKM